ncbi:MAG: sigma 54-interacting transcriptional regulator [Deltaproteobacteria bacterium]|nr:sigma 54-interacting transcriptional regulator [Deltaproteobacteria bacterium]
MGSILVIDDDLSLREIMEMILRSDGHQSDLAENGQVGLEMALEKDYDLIISDIRMPGLSGLDLLRLLREKGRQTTLILISAYASAETAVEAMRHGAYDFIPKPFRNQDLLTAVHSALTHRNVDQERQALVDNIKTHQRFGGLVGSSPAMLQVYDLVKRAAQTSTSILITGESGTGKELVARAVHANSTRAEKNFVAINCGGMPEQLVDSELFGYKKGSFTGAIADKQGLVTLADGGTLFLDELAELTLPMQVKLLRLVQEKTYRPVGGQNELSADVRFIAATNKNLETEIMAGRFREDLYYRLNVINIQLPPLRERPMDIALLAHFFLEKYSHQQNKDVRKLSTYALDILQRYHFPGNVRELENIIERSVALEQSNIILPESLRLADFKRGEPGTFPSHYGQSPASQSQFGQSQPGSGAFAPDPARTESFSQVENPTFLKLPPGGLDDILTSLEVYYLFHALLTADGRRSLAAKLVNISPWRIRVRLTALGLTNLDGPQLKSISPDRYPKPPLSQELAPEWTGANIDLVEIMRQVERHYIHLAMKQSGDNKTEAAMLLGLTLRAFKHRVERANYDQEAAKLAILEGRPPK